MSVLRPLGFLLVLSFVSASLSAQDPKSPYQAAVEARLSGDAESAVRLLEPILRQDPEDVDARVQLGYAYLATGQIDQAKVQFDTVLQMAPDYTDAREGLSLVAQRKAASNRSRSWLRLEGAVSDLGSGRQDWSEIGISGSLPIGSRDALIVSGVRYERFDLADSEVTATYISRPNDNLWLRAGGSVTPNADFRPSVGLTAGIDWRLMEMRDATILSADLSWRSFDTQDVWILTPSLTQYLASGRASLTGRVDALLADGDQLLFGGLARADIYPDADTRIFVGAASGPDTDFGTVSSRESIFGGLEMPLGKGLVVSASLAKDWRDGNSDRTEFRMGMRVEL